MRIVSIQSVCDEFIEAVSEINDYIAKCNIAFASNGLQGATSGIKKQVV